MDRHPHWLTRLKTGHLPELHLALDTEARIETVGGCYHHRFACASTTLVHLQPSGATVPQVPRAHPTPAEVWDRIHGLADATGRLTVWAHNLAYDLRVSDGLAQLVERGWELETISLAKQATWCSWTRERATLTLVDSMSWVPAPLAVIARDLGSHREPFDYQSATAGQLVLRCLSDCQLLAQAVAELLDYLRDNDLGPLRPTGSGQSHAALRKRFLPERSIRVHCDTRALALEREAMHTGRCEAWRWGKINGPLHEVDMNLAYCRVAAGVELPGELYGERARPSWPEVVELSASYRVLATVTVETEQPLVPLTLEDRVIWPVGRFSTVLWDPELRLVAQGVNALQIDRVWLYKRTDGLQAMARWLIDRLADPPELTSPVVKRMLKHWARTVVGRCALRFRSWEPWGVHPRDELCISHEVDWETGEAHENLRIGRQMLQLAALTESRSSVPAIPGYVASCCRANLWRLIEHAGPEHVAYMDTDGLLVSEAGWRELQYHADQLADLELRHKGRHTGVTIYGPRNVELGSERRLSGVPRKAISLGELTFEGETWQGLATALETGHADAVEVAPRRWQVTPVDNRRVHLGGGATEPHRIEDHADL